MNRVASSWRRAGYRRVLGLLLTSLIGVALVTVGTSGVALAKAPRAPKAPKPTITGFVSDPASLPYTGGQVTFTADVTNATSCTFDVPLQYSDTVPCSDGGTQAVFTIPENERRMPAKYSLELIATGSGGSKKAKTKLVVAKNPDLCAHPGPGADLQGCNLSDRVYEGVNWNGANLTDADLEGTNFTDANLEGANLTGANLTDTNLTGSNVQGTVLTDSNLTGTDFHPEYYGLISSGGIVGTPSFLPEYVEIIDGYLVSSSANLENAELAGAELANLDLNATHFNEADLEGADLTDAGGGFEVFIDANLTNANLTGVDLTGSTLQGATLTGATLTGITWNDTTCPDGTNSNNDGGTCASNLG